MRNIIFIVLILTTSSCANYIKSMHSQMGKKGRKNNTQKPNPQFNAFSKSPSIKKNSYPQKINSQNFFEDSENGSLWNNKISGNFLFINKKIFKIGDVILINVNKNLRNEITLELSRVFQNRNLRNPKKDTKQTEGEKAENNPDAEENEKKENEVKYDQIPGVVHKHIGEKYILLKGRKEVFFKKRKRLIELQALLTKDSIEDTNTVNSSQFIEHNITILR